MATINDFRAVVDELRALRLTRNLPQRTIARRMGICRSAITRLENDPTRDPHLSTILRYAHAIGASITITPIGTKTAEGQVKSTPPQHPEEHQ